MEKRIFCSCKLVILRYISAIMNLAKLTLIMKSYNALRVLLSCMKGKNKDHAKPKQGEVVKHTPQNFDQGAYGRDAHKPIIIHADKPNFSLVSINIIFGRK